MSTFEPALSPDDLAKLFTVRAAGGDLDGILALYEPGAVIDFPSGSSDPTSLPEILRQLIGAGTDLEFEQRPTICNGDLALTSVRFPDGSCSAEIARRQSDGSWRWVIDRPNFAPGSTV